MSTFDLSSLQVRATGGDDFDRLEAFIEPFVVEGRILPRTTDELRDLMQHGFLAEVEGQLVGFAALEVYSSKLVRFAV